MKTKKDDRPRCQSCSKLATRNFQECWVEWSIDRKGNYSDEPVDIDNNGDNCFFCDECEY